jgi:dTMP kinase
MFERGKYIITEGTDATGKSTVADLLAVKARMAGYEVIRVDEPDSAFNEQGEVLVPIASELRKIIKNGDLGRTALTNVLLFTAARLENWEQATKPALERGAWVIGARNWLSTLVYQGYGEGFDLDIIKDLTKSTIGDEYLSPNHLFILDLEDEKERSRRLSERGVLDTPDTFESRGDDFQLSLRKGYRAVAKDYDIEIVSAVPLKDEVASTIWKQINTTKNTRLDIEKVNRLF